MGDSKPMTTERLARIRDLAGYYKELHEAEARDLLSEVDRLRAAEEADRENLVDILAWVEGLAAGATCAFCSPLVTDERRADMERHVLVCPQHPAHRLRAALSQDLPRRASEELVALRGVADAALVYRGCLDAEEYEDSQPMLDALMAALKKLEEVKRG